MTLERLFEKLDMEGPEEFQYYENLEALLEEDEHIEQELIREILRYADPDALTEHIGNFFDGFSSNIPDEETELAIIIDTFKSNLLSAVVSDMQEENIDELASEIYAFRKWYSLDHHATDESSGEEISVRDARYEILASGLLGEEFAIDFGKAVTNGPEVYSVRIKDII